MVSYRGSRVAQLFSLGHDISFVFFVARDFGISILRSGSFVADLSSYSFADSDVGEQEFAFGFSVEFLSDIFMKIHATWPNTALEPTRITPCFCREGFWLADVISPRGSAFVR